MPNPQADGQIDEQTLALMTDIIGGLAGQYANKIAQTAASQQPGQPPAQPLVQAPAQPTPAAPAPKPQPKVQKPNPSGSEWHKNYHQKGSGDRTALAIKHPKGPKVKPPKAETPPSPTVAASAQRPSRPQYVSPEQPTQAPGAQPPPDQSQILEEIKREAQGYEQSNHGTELAHWLRTHYTNRAIISQFEAAGVQDLDTLAQILSRDITLTAGRNTNIDQPNNAINLTLFHDDQSPFVILSQPREDFTTGGIPAVVVGPPYASQVHKLETAFPGVHFMAVQEAPKELEEAAAILEKPLPMSPDITLRAGHNDSTIVSNRKSIRPSPYGRKQIKSEEPAQKPPKPASNQPAPTQPPAQQENPPQTKPSGLKPKPSQPPVKESNVGGSSGLEKPVGTPIQGGQETQWGPEEWNDDSDLGEIQNISDIPAEDLPPSELDNFELVPPEFDDSEFNDVEEPEPIAPEQYQHNLELAIRAASYYQQHKQLAQPNYNQPLPDEQEIAKGTFEPLRTESLHSGQLGKLVVDGVPYFYKEGLERFQVARDIVACTWANALGVPAPYARQTPSLDIGSHGKAALLTSWVEGHRVGEIIGMLPPGAIMDALERLVDPLDIDRQIFFTWWASLSDRHWGNYMVSGNRLVTIDHEFENAVDIPERDYIGLTNSDLFQARLAKLVNKGEIINMYDVPLNQKVAGEMAEQEGKSLQVLQGLPGVDTKRLQLVRARGRALLAFSRGKDNTLNAFRDIYRQGVWEE